MKTWCTKIRAINPLNGELRTFAGPNIQAFTPKMAAQYLQDNGLGYCEIDGELVMDIPCKPGTVEPDWKNAVDLEKVQYN